MRSRLATLAFLLLATSIQARDIEARFKNYTTQDGLPNNWVRCIYQDESDFMWLGTADGLCRFDGYNFSTYRLKNKENQELGNININAIARKGEREMWVCTDIGLFTYDQVLDTLIPARDMEPTAYFCITEDSSHKLWLGTCEGLVCYDQSTREKTKFESSNKPNSISNNRVSTIFIDSGGRLWAGTQNGLNLFDASKGTFLRIMAAGQPGNISGNDILGICEDKKHRLWVGTARKGLNVLENMYSGVYYFTEVCEGDVLDVRIDRQGNLWIACGAEHGLKILDLETFIPGSKARFQELFNSTSPTSLCNNSIFCIYEDKSSDMWLGSIGSGASYLSRKNKLFHMVNQDKKACGVQPFLSDNMVNTFFEEENFLWIGSEGGIDRLDKRDGSHKHYSYDENTSRGLSSNPVLKIARDKKENLWVGTWSGGLNLFDYKTETFKRFTADGKPGSISNNNIYSIFDDSRGNVWVGTLGGGVNKLDLTSWQFTHLTHEWDKPRSLFYNYIDDILETSKGALYVSTYYSIDRYNYKTGDFDHFVFNKHKNASGGQIITLYEDSRRRIWVGTNAGLYLFDETRGQFSYYPASDELPNKTIQGILEDDYGNLWLSTNMGIVKLKLGKHTTGTPEISVYTESDGLPTNEFNKRAVYKGKNGTLYFGSSHGYMYFHPDSISMNYLIPTIAFTDFRLLMSTPGKNTRERLPRNINYTDTIKLSHEQSDFSLSYSALNYLNPGKNSFKYKLEGYDKTWIDAGNQRTATYTNIEPGTYIFKVLASNNDGVWNETPKTLTIIITPPWWRTVTFKILFSLALISAIVLVYIRRSSHYKKQKSTLEQMVSERTAEIMEKNNLLVTIQEEITQQNYELERHRNKLEEMVANRTVAYEKARRRAEESDRLKSAFLANFSHEIRTPLNAVIGFSQLLKNDQLSSNDKSQYIEHINTSSESLLVMINDIMDISLIETNQLTINRKTFNAHAVLSELESYYKLQAANRVEVQYVDKTGDLLLKNDRNRFRQVVVNLIDNAMKFTDQGFIHFGIKEYDKHVLFFVADTGIGIDTCELDRIFDHFYKVDKNENKIYRGTGIGLALCKKMVELMGGTISVESEVSKGSTFSFTLPKDQDPGWGNSTEHHRASLHPLLKKTVVLVAEDEPTNFEVIRSMLKNNVSGIIWAHDGQEAIDYVRDMPPGTPYLVLMDIRMPGVNGYKALETIRAFNPRIPIIAVTAYAQPNERQKIIDAGFDDYISKPIHVEQLLLTLSKICNNV